MTQIVLTKIVDWSKDKPKWQRDALRRIVNSGGLTEQDINELIDICKFEVGLKSKIITSVPIDEQDIPSEPENDNSVVLRAISGVQNVNKLAGNQLLSFSPSGITIIYGDNGAGKSGYVRILKRACRARHASEILDNVYVTKGENKKPSATFQFNMGTHEKPSENWEDNDKPHPVLSAISVFDKLCADIQIGKGNEIAFRPYGLDIPDQLVKACKLINKNLADEKKILEEENKIFFQNPFWNESTPTGVLLSKINSKTNVEDFETCKLSKAEKIRLEQLSVDLEKDPQKAAAEQTLKADNIKRLSEKIGIIENTLSDEFFERLNQMKHEVETTKKSMDLAASKAFSSGSLEGIGSQEWRSLWEAARLYYTEKAYPNKHFPALEEDLLCVLCQQPLTSEAVQRMQDFEAFIQNNLSKRNKEANTNFTQTYQNLLDLNLQFSTYKGLIDEVSLHDTAVSKKIRRFIASARLRRYCYNKQLDRRELISLPSLSSSTLKQLDEIEKLLRNYAQELIKSSNQEQRKKLQSEFNELQNKDKVIKNIQTIKKTIERLKVIEQYNQSISLTSTNNITILSNQLSDAVVTPMLRDRFQEELTKLAADKVRVEIVRSGGRDGASQYQVKLFANPKVKVNTILSEGEQTCVAFAAFLSELATANHHSALIFDDPVSSLDHRWRNKIAKRLVDESKRRQIIVFAHDLVFVNDLYDLACTNNIPIKTQTLTHGPTGSGVVTEGLPWKGKSIKDRIDTLEKLLKSAEQLYQNNEDDNYFQEAINIYNKLRATWERGLEEICFARVILRYRDYINTKDLMKVSVLTSNDCEIFEQGFKKCCDITDAHDPSLGRNTEIPSPSEIKQDIESLKQWSNDIKSRQKNA